MKKILFDTSVIFAASRGNHGHFKEAFSWVSAVRGKRISAFISTHCLAELYANSTKYPLPPQIPPPDALLFLQKEVIPYFESIPFSLTDYEKALERVVQKGLKGGIIYDSLHIQAALKKKVDALVTLNSKDFIRLIEPHELKIINPLETTP